MDACENCERLIGKMETPRLLLGRVVCVECDGRLRAQLVPPATAVGVPLATTDHGSKRLAAGLLAIFVGGLGIHRLYLGHAIGIIYLIFCWTFIPAIVGLIEGIIFLTMSDADFVARYQSPALLKPSDSAISDSNSSRPLKSFRLS